MFRDYLAVLCQGNIRSYSRKMRNSHSFPSVFTCPPLSAHLKYLPAFEEAHLAMLMDTYDQETNEHARRTMILAAALSRQMHFSHEEVLLICLAALVHDIGKAAIPSPILTKPGPLSAEEWQIMRLHPAIGARMLVQVGGIFLNLEHIVMAHHEHWDGSGYPSGLSKEAIPLSARILAVADSFDAMTMPRVYRQLYSLPEVRRELVDGSGKQYDPGVVATFLSLLDQGKDAPHPFPAHYGEG